MLLEIGDSYPAAAGNSSDNWVRHKEQVRKERDIDLLFASQRGGAFILLCQRADTLKHLSEFINATHIWHLTHCASSAACLTACEWEYMCAYDCVCVCVYGSVSVVGGCVRRCLSVALDDAQHVLQLLVAPVSQFPPFPCQHSAHKSQIIHAATPI